MLGKYLICFFFLLSPGVLLKASENDSLKIVKIFQGAIANPSKIDAIVKDANKVLDQSKDPAIQNI